MRDERIGQLKKLSMIASGGLLVLLGVVTFWLPLPIGVPLILLGAPLLLRHSPRATGAKLATSSSATNPI